MRIAVKDAPVVAPRAGLREADGRAPLLMIAPVLPAEFGNGLAMRAGLFLDALSQDFAVHLLVVPLFGPVDREAAPIFVVERIVQWAVLPISPESEPLFMLYSRIKDPVRRAAALTDYPRPALARFATGQALERVAAVWRDTSFSAVHVMRLYLAPFAAPWIGGGGPRPRCILDLDDIEHRTRRRLAALHRRNGNALAGRIEEAEAGKYQTLAERLCPRFDTVLVCSEKDAGALRRAWIDDLLSDRGKVGFTIRLHPRIGYTAYAEYRLFRNDPRIRFRGAIHEKIPPALYEVARADGLAIGESDLALDHVGYEGDQRRKHLRNLPLLRRQVETEPDRVFLWVHLGNVLAGLGDDAGAEEAWRRGIEVVRRTGATGPEDSLPYLELIRWRFERGLAVDGLLAEAVTLFPGNHLLSWIRGRILMKGDRADLEAALALFEQLAGIDDESFFDPEIAYDKRIFGLFAYDSLGLCCFRLGRFQESERYYALAARCDPDSPEYRAKRLMAATRAEAAGSTISAS